MNHTAAWNPESKVNLLRARHRPPLQLAPTHPFLTASRSRAYPSKPCTTGRPCTKALPTPLFKPESSS
jgi:hypothetical protein